MSHQVAWLEHPATGRVVPLDVLTVFGRSAAYYRYQPHDERPLRIGRSVSAALEQLDYVQIVSDEGVSRTHGLLDPTLPGLADLNSTNGTLVNGHALPACEGQTGPMRTLHDGDVIVVGEQDFVFRTRALTAAELAERLAALRRGLVACDRPRAARAARVRAHLIERKGFAEVEQTVGPGALIAGLQRLRTRLRPEGLVVVSIHAAARGPELLLEAGPADPAPGPLAFARLLPLVSALPGRKVLLLDLDGDPSACERRFAEEGYEDTVLVTAPGDVPLEDAVRTALHTEILDGLRSRVAGAADGAYDEAVDGLDALIPVDTNRLAVTFIDDYRGRLAFQLGRREREETSALSHSLRLGSTTFRFGRGAGGLSLA